MSKLLKKLIEHDCKLNSFIDDQEIIEQGIAPIIVLNKPSITLQKANLLEQSKYLNWQEKAKILFEQLDLLGIKFLVLKGFAYTFSLYDNSHIRPYSDIDVLVDEADYKKTEKLLIELGYTKLLSRQGKFISYQNSFYDDSIHKTTIDLHWQINNRIEFHQHFQFERLYSAAIKIESQTINFKTLSPIDAFILASCHYQGHRPNDRKHIWLYDLALLWSNMSLELQTITLEVVHKRQQSQIVNSVLKLLQSTFINCIEATIENTNAQEETQKYLQHRNSKITDFKIKLKSIKGYKNKFLFLCEYVFQNKNYVKNRYKLNSNIWVYFYYPRMWIEDIFKLFKK